MPSILDQTNLESTRVKGISHTGNLRHFFLLKVLSPHNTSGACYRILSSVVICFVGS